MKGAILCSGSGSAKLMLVFVVVLIHGSNLNVDAFEEEPVCEQAKIIGLCGETLQRFYHDKDAGACKQFTYGGCGGNDNNFGTKKECEEKCNVVTQVVTNECELPKVVGRCRGAFQRVYYDQQTDSCREFIFGGCGGNANNFKTLQDCRKRCKINRNRRDVCDRPRVVGNCRGSFPRIYYDKRTDSCRRFIFGGCGGNGNNFKTFQDCRKRCKFNNNKGGRGKWHGFGKKIISRVVKKIFSPGKKIISHIGRKVLPGRRGKKWF